MIGDSITLSDGTANHIFTKVSMDGNGSTYANQSRSEGSVDSLTIRQSVDKKGKRRAVVRIDMASAPSEALPSPSTASAYVVLELNTKETGNLALATLANTCLKNFTTSTDVVKVLKGEY